MLAAGSRSWRRGVPEAGRNRRRLHDAELCASRNFTTGNNRSRLQARLQPLRQAGTGDRERNSNTVSCCSAMARAASPRRQLRRGGSAAVGGSKRLNLTATRPHDREFRLRYRLGVAQQLRPGRAAIRAERPAACRPDGATPSARHNPLRNSNTVTNHDEEKKDGA